MGKWDYKREEPQYAKIPAGLHRVRIEDVEMTTSKAGNDMIKITLSVSGMNRTLWDYIVFMEDHPEITNSKFTAIFDSFGIEDGDTDIAHWVGQVGAAKTKIDENEYEKVQFYVSRKGGTYAGIPAWVEPTRKFGSSQSSESASSGSYPLPKDDGDLPF